jgi:hypothetical protein
MEDFDPQDLFDPPNGAAYTKDEFRTGPPLDYVAEKLRRAIETTQFLSRTINASKQSDAEQKEKMASYTMATFRYQLTAYLALKNLLALAGDQSLFERLLKYSTTDFTAWINKIDHEGSLHDS